MLSTTDELPEIEISLLSNYPFIRRFGAVDNNFLLHHLLFPMTFSILFYYLIVPYFAKNVLYFNLSLVTNYLFLFMFVLILVAPRSKLSFFVFFMLGLLFFFSLLYEEPWLFYYNLYSASEDILFTVMGILFITTVILPVAIVNKYLQSNIWNWFFRSFILCIGVFHLISCIIHEAIITILAIFIMGSLMFVICSSPSLFRKSLHFDLMKPYPFDFRKLQHFYVSDDSDRNYLAFVKEIHSEKSMMKRLLTFLDIIFFGLLPPFSIFFIAVAANYMIGREKETVKKINELFEKSEFGVFTPDYIARKLKKNPIYIMKILNLMEYEGYLKKMWGRKGVLFYNPQILPKDKLTDLKQKLHLTTRVDLSDFEEKILEIAWLASGSCQVTFSKIFYLMQTSYPSTITPSSTKFILKLLKQKGLIFWS